MQCLSSVGFRARPINHVKMVTTKDKRQREKAENTHHRAKDHSTAVLQFN